MKNNEKKHGKNKEKLMNIMKHIKNKIDKTMKKPMEKQRKTNEHNEAYEKLF